MIHQGLPVDSRHDAMRGSINQANADLSFHLRNALRERRLGDVQTVSRSFETALLDQFAQSNETQRINMHDNLRSCIVTAPAPEYRTRPIRQTPRFKQAC